MFPETRHTLIQRLATSGQETEWQQCLSDYWRPVCRFAARWGRLGTEDAEDVASTTFEALIRNRLLSRWVLHRQAKLRTLLCIVIRNVISNRARVQQGRERLVREHAGELDRLLTDSLDAPPDQIDAFYLSWTEELLQTAVGLLLEEYHREGRGDYFRVLYGRICEQMTSRQVADSLDIKLTDAENFYKHARQRLAAGLERLVREHVERYTPADQIADEFRVEWQMLGECLKGRGGLERALRESYEGFDSEQIRRREKQSLTAVLNHVREHPDGNRH